MDSLPGTPQIQNIIPTTFFKTDDLGRAVARRDRRASSSSLVGLRYLELAPAPGRRGGRGLRRRAMSTSPSRSRDEQAGPSR